eukprot:SAG31_NODE_4630_length_3085_cov_2.376758_5_plen_62_part_00
MLLLIAALTSCPCRAATDDGGVTVRHGNDLQLTFYPYAILMTRRRAVKFSLRASRQLQLNR